MRGRKKASRRVSPIQTEIDAVRATVEQAITDIESIRFGAGRRTANTAPPGAEDLHRACILVMAQHMAPGPVRTGYEAQALTLLARVLSRLSSSRGQA